MKKQEISVEKWKIKIRNKQKHWNRKIQYLKIKILQIGLIAEWRLKGKKSVTLKIDINYPKVGGKKRFLN
jgi:hypothetical protein